MNHFFSMMAAAVFFGAFFLLSVPAADGATTCDSVAGQQCISGMTCAAATPPMVAGTGTCTIGVCCAPSGGGGGTATVTFSNPLSYSTVEGAAGAILTSLQGIIVMLAVVFLVIGGVMYIVSAGNEGTMRMAKGAIFAAMIGLAIGIAAPTFLKEIYGILGSTAPAAVSGATSLATILSNLLGFLLGLVGVLAIIMLVIGGMTYFAAAGDETRADSAKKIIKWALIGIVVVLASLVLVRQIANFF